MKKLSFTLIVLGIFIINGCSEHKPLPPANFSTITYPKDYRKKIKHYMERILDIKFNKTYHISDYYGGSLNTLSHTERYEVEYFYEISKPRKGYIHGNIFSGFKKEDGYIVKATARRTTTKFNDFGKKYKFYFFITKDHKIKRIITSLWGYYK